MEIGNVLPWTLAAVGILWGVIKTLSTREVARYDDVVIRVGVVEKTYVTKDELSKVILNLREERKEMHSEAREHLNKIDKNVDETRHVLNGSVGTLSVKVAVLEKVMELIMSENKAIREKATEAA